MDEIIEPFIDLGRRSSFDSDYGIVVVDSVVKTEYDGSITWPIGLERGCNRSRDERQQASRDGPPISKDSTSQSFPIHRNRNTIEILLPCPRGTRQVDGYMNPESKTTLVSRSFVQSVGLIAPDLPHTNDMPATLVPGTGIVELVVIIRTPEGRSSVKAVSAIVLPDAYFGNLTSGLILGQDHFVDVTYLPPTFPASAAVPSARTDKPAASTVLSRDPFTPVDDEVDVEPTCPKNSNPLFINAIQQSLCRWLDSKLVLDSSTVVERGQTTSGGSTSTGDSVSSSGANVNGEGSRPFQADCQKRGRDDLNREDNGDDYSKKRSREDTTLDLDGVHPMFACPFFKRNPRKFGRVTTCPGPGWTEVRRVKDHLYRRHALPPQCPRCWDAFETEAIRDQHLQSNPPCNTRPNDKPLEGFTKAQEKLLRSRKKSDRNQSEADRWRDMYRILFPDDNPGTIPIPYQEEVDITKLPPAGSYADFAAFSRREFPCFVRREVELLFETNSYNSEHELRQQLEVTILGVQARFLRFYDASMIEEGANNWTQTPGSLQVAASSTTEQSPGLSNTNGGSVFVSPEQAASDTSGNAQQHYNNFHANSSLFDFAFDWDSSIGRMFDPEFYSQDGF